MFLGRDFSSQVRSIRFEAILRLENRSFCGIRRCIVVGK